MVGPTEASPPVLSPPESTKTPPAPTKAPSNAIPVEVMAEVPAKQTAPVPVEALSKAEPVAALPSSLRAVVPAWPIPATNPILIPSVPPPALRNHALSALHQGDGVLPPVEHIPFPVLSVCPHQSDGQDPSAPIAGPLTRLSGPSSDPIPIVEPSSRQISANRDFAGPSLSPSSCAPVDTNSFANMRLSPRAQEWIPDPGLSPKEELQLLIAQSTQQLQSSTS
jgi:hypothetical protein